MKTIIYTIIIYVASVFSANAQTLALFNKKPKYSSEANYDAAIKKDEITSRKIKKANNKRMKSTIKDIKKSKKDFGTKQTRNYFKTTEYNKQQTALNKKATQSLHSAKENKVSMKKATTSENRSKVLIRG